MKEKDYLALLAKREIQPTAIRILVLQAMLKAGRSVSLLDLENMLDTVDKSSIFRTITLFLSHHLIHSIDDGFFQICGMQCKLLLRSQRPAHSFSLRELQQDILLPEYPYTGSTSTGRVYAEQHQLCTERALSGMCGKR